MIDPTAMPAFALPLRLGELAPGGGRVMFGRTVGVEDTRTIVPPGVEFALIDVALIIDEVAEANMGEFLASVVSVSHWNPSAGRLL